MAVESKPLFHPEVMRQQVRSFTLPEHVPASQPKLQHWADFIGSGRADGISIPPYGNLPGESPLRLLPGLSCNGSR